MIETDKQQQLVHRHKLRRHRLVDQNRRQSPDTVVIHYSAGSNDCLALSRYLARAKISYHIGIGRDGETWQWVDENDAAWHSGGAFALDATRLLEDGFSPAKGAKAVPRLANLRSVGIVLCNRGYMTPTDAIACERGGGEVVTARHANPMSRSTRWEGYTGDQIISLRCVIRQLREALPTLQIVTGHEDIANAHAFGGGRPVTGRGKTKVDPGPAFPWHNIEAAGLKRVAYSYEAGKWTVVPPVTGSGVRCV